MMSRVPSRVPVAITLVLLAGLPALAPAAHGHARTVRLTVGPFPIEAHRDREVCRVVKVPGVPGMQIDFWEARSRTSRRGTVGTHHFVAYSYDGADSRAFPGPDQLVDDPGCSSLGPSDFFKNRRFLAGSGGEHQERNWSVTKAGMPAGLTQLMPTPTDNPGTAIVILNSHYFNQSDTRANGFVKLKLRLAPLDPSKRPVRQVIETRASRDIKVAPGAVAPVAGDWAADGARNVATDGGTNPSGDVCLLALTPHMHKRGTEFTIAYREDGKPEKIFEPTRDYLHPRTILFPILDAAAPGVLHGYDAEHGFPHFHYACTMANGAEEKAAKMGCEETAGVTPGRAAAEAHPDDDQALGLDDHARPCGLDAANCQGFGTGRCVPANLVFGPLSDDEMCILTAMVFDPKPGVPPAQACNPNF